MRKVVLFTAAVFAGVVATPASAFGVTVPARSVQGLKTVTGSFTLPDGWSQSRGEMEGTPIVGKYQKAWPLPSGDLCLASVATYWTGMPVALKPIYANGHLKIPAPSPLSGFKTIASTATSGSTSIYFGAFQKQKPYSALITASDSYGVLPTGALAGKVKGARRVVVKAEMWVWMSGAARAVPGQAACRTIAATSGNAAVAEILTSFTLS